MSRLAYGFVVAALLLSGCKLFKKESASTPSDGQQSLQDPKNGVMMQAFHWYTSEGGVHWAALERDAESLAKAGFTAMWLPPAYKAMKTDDVGYAVYDIYDLGEFDQKGAIRTKYGTKDQYSEFSKLSP